MELGILSSKKQIISFSALLVFSVACVSIFSLFAKRLDEAKFGYFNLQKELELERIGIWHLEKLDRKALDRELEMLQARFPSHDNLATLIGEITELAKKHKMTVASLVPREIAEIQEEKKEKLEALSRIPMELRLAGSFVDFAGFLADLSTLPHGIITVDQYRLEKQSGESTLLNLTLTLSVYARKTKEENILEQKFSLDMPIQRKAGMSRSKGIARDPFNQKIVPVEEEAVINLEGIIYDPVQPIVLIGGETRKVGDVVAGMTIAEIHPEYVVFKKDGEQTVVRLYQE